MKYLPTIIGAILSVTIFLPSCQQYKPETEVIAEATENTEEPTIQKTENFPKVFIGKYAGIQLDYFIKDQFGDDMIINGNKIHVPSCYYYFILKENNIVGLGQKDLENNENVYYSGSYQIISNNSDTIKIECSLHSNDKISNPTYILLINKGDKQGICTGGGSPEFHIETTENPIIR
jgi:hypothetical protein